MFTRNAVVKNPDHVLLVDAFNLIHRAAYKAKTKSLKDGNHYLRLLIEAVLNHAPSCEDRIAVFDGADSGNRRRRLLPSYKPKSTDAPDQFLIDLKAGAPAVFEKVGLTCVVSVDGYEADDVIATFAKSYLDAIPEARVLIATGDKDMFALMADSRVSVLRQGSSSMSLELYAASDVFSKMGIAPCQVTDFLTLAGDSSDGIPGVEGIGEQSARDLLQQYVTLDGIFAHISELGTRLTRCLSAPDAMSRIQLSRNLVQMATDAKFARLTCA